MAITDTQSYTLVICDAFYDALAGDPFFTDYTMRKTKMLQVQHQLIPYLGVYLIDETMTPDGDFNAGDIRFCHTVRVGFSALIAQNDEASARASLDAIFWHIMIRLWRDADLTNMITSSMPDNVRMEGITRGTRRHVYGDAGLNNETPVAELQYDVSVFYRSEWFPTITDDLLEIDVKTGIKIGETQEEMDQRQQIHVDYKFEAQQRRLRNGRG